MNILGIWDGHDSGAALLENGRLRFAVNEERLSRRKLEISFPTRSIEACLANTGIRADEIDVVAATTSDPAKTLGRLWPGSKERYYAVRRRKTPPGPLAGVTRALKYRMTEWSPGPLSRMLSTRVLRRQLERHGLTRAELQIVDHHRAHAIAAAAASGFSECAVLTIDGLGDGLSATISRFADGRLERVAESSARNSIGVFFEHVTSLLNMRELEDEGKVMALADYAAPVADADNPMLPWVRVVDGVVRTAWPGHAFRRPLAQVHWRFANEQFAYLAQRTVEHAAIALARDAVRLTGCARLALAGGVVSNVKATRQVRRLPEVERDLRVSRTWAMAGLRWVLPSLRPRSLAIRRPSTLDRLDLGPSFDRSTMDRACATLACSRRAPATLPSRVADLLADGRIVMWFQGAMEYGPRALGHRSVLARPDRADAARPPEPGAQAARLVSAVLSEHARERSAATARRLGRAGRTGHMTMAYMVASEHRDRPGGRDRASMASCRPQIVQDDDERPVRGTAARGCGGAGASGAVLNTSFNIHGEPLVCTPREAVDVFLRSGADALAIGPFLVARPA